MRKIKKRKRKRYLSWEDVASVCAWCGKHIPEDTEVFSLGARARPGVDLEKMSKGNVLELALDEKKEALAIVPTQDSEAKRMGWDLLFSLCSEECARTLKETLQKQLDIIDSITNVA
jgi:hypothetical protein